MKASHPKLVVSLVLTLLFYSSNVIAEIDVH